MPLQDYDGTTSYEIGKLYDNDGTTNYQIGKIFDNDGATSSLIYTASVNMTNLVGSAEQTVLNAWTDHGVLSNTVNGITIPTVTGHRYYVRASATANVGGCSHGYTNSYGYATAKFVEDIVKSGNGNSIVGHAIVTALADNTVLQLATSRGDSDQGSTSAAFYMVVDITQYEEDTGVTYTADSFWEAIGSTIFYNSKEFET